MNTTHIIPAARSIHRHSESKLCPCSPTRQVEIKDGRVVAEIITHFTHR